jgi:hypothetical protein
MAAKVCLNLRLGVLRFFAEIRCVARRCALVVLFGLSRVIICLSRMLFGLGGIRHK